MVGTRPAESVSEASTMDESQETELLIAINAADNSRVHQLLEDGAQTSFDNSGRTLLLAAILQIDLATEKFVCNLQVVKDLLGHGADPNCRCTRRWQLEQPPVRRRYSSMVHT
jgi:ankyrin repeat protein